jgi:hypothetical protein
MTAPGKLYDVLGLLLVLGVGGYVGVEMVSDRNHDREVADALAQIDAVAAQVRTAEPSSYFDGRGDEQICGRGRSIICLKPADGVGTIVFETDYSPKIEPTVEDRGLCETYYRFFFKTGRVDPYLDWHCYQRWLKPVMVPDPTR